MRGSGGGGKQEEEIIITVRACNEEEEEGGRGGGGGGGGTRLLAFDIRTLTTHPFREGTPFLLLVGTIPTFWLSVRSFQCIAIYIFAELVFVPLWPSVATAYLLG